MSDISSTRGDTNLPQATLGKTRETPFTYSPDLLEAVPLVERDLPGQTSWVSLCALRFTSLCPVTGQPDWAEITLNYLPNGTIVESKSLKEYLTSFRMHGDFHEDVCRVICRDLTDLIKPRYCEVIGHFDSRGSIAIWPYVQWADASDAAAQDLLARRQADYAPGRWAPAPGTVR